MMCTLQCMITLLAHKPVNSICFLCSKHHIELDRLKNNIPKYTKALKIYKDLIEKDYHILYKKKNSHKPTNPIPSFPLGLKLKINKKSITISWSHTPNADEYILFKNGLMVDKGNKLSYNDKDITSISGSEYELFAINSFGCSEKSVLSI
jgi:hypothetical protein